MPGFVHYPTKRGPDYTCARSHPSGQPGLWSSCKCPDLGDLLGIANGDTTPGQLPPQGTRVPSESGGPRGSRCIPDG